MFNNSILHIGNFREQEIIRKEFAVFQRDIFNYVLDFLDDDCPKYFLEEYFPPRYYREHTKTQLQNILFDIRDIIFSDVIREELSPIYTYVLYKILETYKELIDDQEIELKPPIQIRNMLKFSKIELEDKDWIIDMFIDPYFLLDDFCETYDGDLTDDDFLEKLAYLYIYQPELYDSLGANIEDAIELLPKDLADLFLKAQAQRHSKTSIPCYDFFISYASEDKNYAKQSQTLWLQMAQPFGWTTIN